MGRKNRNASHINMDNIFRQQANEHIDENSVDFENGKSGPIMEHMSNARIMPLTGPYGGLDLKDTYEYAGVPQNPGKPMEGYELIKEKNTEK